MTGKRGDKKCIGGQEYEYVPPTTKSTSVDGAVDVSTLSQMINQMAGDAQELAAILTAEFTYTGAYREVPSLQIPANRENYQVDIGFPARTFRLNTEAPIVIRLGSTQADAISLDHQTSPFELSDLPAGLAFATFYVTNANTVPITVDLFAMG